MLGSCSAAVVMRRLGDNKKVRQGELGKEFGLDGCTHCCVLGAGRPGRHSRDPGTGCLVGWHHAVLRRKEAAGHIVCVSKEDAQAPCGKMWAKRGQGQQGVYNENRLAKTARPSTRRCSRQLASLPRLPSQAVAQAAAECRRCCLPACPPVILPLTGGRRWAGVRKPTP